MRSLAAAALDAVAALARTDPQRFWAAVVDDIGIDWVRRFDTAMDTSDGLPWTRFWVGGRMNLAANAVHRWGAAKPDAVAAVWLRRGRHRLAPAGLRREGALRRGRIPAAGRIGCSEAHCR